MKNQASASSAPTRAADKKKPASPKKANGPIASQADASATGRDEMIRQNAYFLYESRSREGGHALDDWLQAEAQLVSPTQLGVPIPGM